MRRGYIDPRRRATDISTIVGIVGWLVALAIGAIFAWYALLGPGRAQTSAEPTEAVSAAPTDTALPVAPTEPPTDEELRILYEELDAEGLYVKRG